MMIRLDKKCPQIIKNLYLQKQGYLSATILCVARLQVKLKTMLYVAPNFNYLAQTFLAYS